jgi:hypothetical protein
MSRYRAAIDPQSRPAGAVYRGNQTVDHGGQEAPPSRNLLHMDRASSRGAALSGVEFYSSAGPHHGGPRLSSLPARRFFVSQPTAVPNGLMVA